MPVAEETNMFGLAPCPKCKEPNRYPMTTGVIRCDDCGYTEPARTPAGSPGREK